MNRSIVTDVSEDMGRIRSAENFVRTINGEESPLNTPEQALGLMKIIDATYASAKAPVQINSTNRIPTQPKTPSKFEKSWPDL